MKTTNYYFQLISILIVSVSLIFSACEKEDEVYTNLSGDCDLHYDFTTINEEVDAEMNLTQSNTSLSGKIDDGKDVFTLLQSCCINGYNVTIKYYVVGDLLKQTGTVNADFNEVNGSFTLRGIYAGTWEAERSKKSAVRSNYFENQFLNEIVDRYAE